MIWLRKLLKRRRLERELVEELAFHREMQAHAGGSPIRNELLVRENMRDQWLIPWVETTIRDIAYALRGFNRNKGFAITAISSLALGIAAVIAIFTAADDLLFRPLPYYDPQQLVMVWEHKLGTDAIHNVVSPGNYLDWRSRNRVFQDIASVNQSAVVLTDRGRADQLRIQVVSSSFFALLGVQPVRGRLFTASEDLASSHSGSFVVISYRLWQSWFAGDPAIIGHRVMVNSVPRTILGVMPLDFYFRDREVDLWSPMGLDPSVNYRGGNSGRFMMALGRLKPGISIDQAQREMTGLASTIERENPVFDKNWTVNLEPLRDSLVGNTRTLLLVLVASVGLLLAVASCNVANLLLARFSSRRSEIAVRMALGAGRTRLLRQLITECLLLALISGALGITLGKYALGVLVALAPESIVRTANIQIDWRIVLFAAGLSVVTGLFFGIVPSIAASKTDVASELKHVSRWGSVRRGNLRVWLTVGEIAISLILLSGAGLLFRTLIELQHADPGIDPSNLLTFRFVLPSARYTNPVDRTALFANAIERIERLPGVRSVSAVNSLPFDGMSAGTSFRIAGRQYKPGELPSTRVRTVMPRYFATMGIPLIRGRDFTAFDNTPEAPLRFIVNQAFVRAQFPAQESLGKSISVNMDNTNPFGEIIGIVGDVRENTLTSDPAPTVYYVHAHLIYNGMVILVRTRNDPTAIMGPVRGIMHDLDPTLPVAGVRSMETVLGATYGRERFGAVLLGGFSFSSLLLAAIGIYGVLAYSVSERTREIGVRLALGARPGRIMTMVIFSGIRLMATGFVIGIVGSFALSRSIAGMLYRTAPTDPLALAAPTVLLAVSALLAASIPAYRAARLDPIQALRVE
jgi:putative ABC transport system permease protein